MPYSKTGARHETPRGITCLGHWCLAAPKPEKSLARSKGLLAFQSRGVRHARNPEREDVLETSGGFSPGGDRPRKGPLHLSGCPPGSSVFAFKVRVFRGAPAMRGPLLSPQVATGLCAARRVQLATGLQTSPRASATSGCSAPPGTLAVKNPSHTSRRSVSGVVLY